jgi:nucleotide-binding universal stress UspA family protein
MGTMNVLVATDGSKYGRWALDWVAMLPFVEPIKVMALHVLDFRTVRALRGPILSQAEGERYLQKEIQRMEVRSANALQKAKQQLASLNLTGTVRKEQGAVAPTILKRAPKRDGFLVVGSKGLDALERFMLGSVSTKIIQYAPCPVLVVKSEAVPVRRIALAIDGSDASAQALKFVLTKFQPDRSTGKGGRVPIQVSVIHVMPFFKYPELKEAGRRLVEESVQKLIHAGFTVEVVSHLGNPAEEIMKVAANQHANLIVMGAKGLGAIARFLLGSVSTRVVQHSFCSVLVVR